MENAPKCVRCTATGMWLSWGRVAETEAGAFAEGVEEELWMKFACITLMTASSNLPCAQSRDNTASMRNTTNTESMHTLHMQLPSTRTLVTKIARHLPASAFAWRRGCGRWTPR